MLWQHSIAYPSTGTVVAQAEDLAALLDAARTAAPMVERHEDWLPGDPRQSASFSFAGRRHRIHPGLTEHALDTLDELALWAAACDDLVLDVHGFGLADLLGLAVRYSDAATTALAPSWPDTRRPTEFGWAADGSTALEMARDIAALPAVVTAEEVTR